MLICLITLAACVCHQPLIVIDSGHTPADYGAVSCTGRHEVDYNDDLVAEIYRELTQNHRCVILTRTKSHPIHTADELRAYLVDRLDDEKWQQRKNLYSRMALANEKQAGLFLSIHHDSVREHRLRRSEDGGIIDVREDFKQDHDPGYSIFISKDPRYPHTEHNYPDALRFAQIFAARMQAMGRRPCTYHEDRPDQDNYQPIDVTLGIWNSRGLLSILRNAKMPAVLIEAGVIVDADDEKIVSSPVFRVQFARALAASIEAFFEQ